MTSLSLVATVVETRPPRLRYLLREGIGALAEWYVEPVHAIFRSPAHFACLALTVINFCFLLAWESRASANQSSAKSKEARLGVVTAVIALFLYSMMTWVVAVCIIAPLVVRLASQFLPPAGLWIAAFIPPNAFWWVWSAAEAHKARKIPTSGSVGGKT